VLATILQKSAREFEQLVVTLLQKMGYGGKIADAAVVTQYSRDGGISNPKKNSDQGRRTGPGSCAHPSKALRSRKQN